MKNITFSADERLIKKARLRALKERSTLNERFREWLKQYAGHSSVHEGFENLMSKLSYVNSGKKFTRDELNER